MCQLGLSPWSSVLLSLSLCVNPLEPIAQLQLRYMSPVPSSYVL